MPDNTFISVVSPVYFGEKVVVQLVERLTGVLQQITRQYEIILVEDGSPDSSWEIISDLGKRDSHIVGIRLQKNYGQHTAIKAGLVAASGSWIVVMDCDLQDPPEEISNLYAAASDKTEAVMALRTKHWQPVVKRMYSALFYKLLSLFSGIQFQSNTANFGIYRKSVVDLSLKNQSSYFFFPLAIKKAAEHIQYLPVQFHRNSERATAYSFVTAFKLAMNILIAQLRIFSFRSTRQQDYIISESVNLN